MPELRLIKFFRLDELLDELTEHTPKDMQPTFLRVTELPFDEMAISVQAELGGGAVLWWYMSIAISNRSAVFRRERYQEVAKIVTSRGFEVRHGFIDISDARPMAGCIGLLKGE